MEIVRRGWLFLYSEGEVGGKGKGGGRKAGRKGEKKQTASN